MTWTCEFSMNLISSFQLAQGLPGKQKKRNFILCLENWTWWSLIIPSCKCFSKEEERLAFPSVFFQHLKCRPKAIVSRQENWMMSITVQLQPVWDPTADFGYLAMESETKFQFKNFVMCATNVWAACSFVIRVPDLTISRLAARRSCMFFFFYAMDLKLVATAVILASGYLGVTLAIRCIY